jgi:hypothetical protein
VTGGRLQNQENNVTERTLDDLRDDERRDEAGDKDPASSANQAKDREREMEDDGTENAA